jgi:outer membrane protein assembly factor BamA
MGGGLGGLWYGRLAGGGLSVMKASVRFTQNRQIMAAVVPELDLGDLRLHLRLGYERFPDHYFGIGPDAPETADETYTPITWLGQADGEYRVAGPLFVGGDLEVRRTDFQGQAPEGLLAAAPGARGGLTLGLGAHVSWDTRDLPRAPRTGSLLRLSAMHFDDTVGDYAFDRFALDARRFFPLFGDHVLALRGFVELQRGDVPFFQMAMLGGSDVLRGMYRGRFRDAQLAAVQAEYRLPLFWRLGLAGFVEAGSVAPTPGELLTEVPKLGAGLGLRVAVNREDGLHLRFDLGHAEGHTQFYFTFDEAF